FPEVWEAFDVPREGGLGHRLDQGTSGVLLVARTAEAHAALRRAFTEHRCEKTYEALVAGRVPAKGLHIDAPIAHDPADATRMVVGAGRGQPRNAQSRVRTLRSSSEASWVCLQTSTGARHQVRVHLASRGHPLVGDALYGGPASLLGHPWLHARSVRLPEDLTRAWGLAEASFQAPVPGPFVEAAAALGLPPTGGHSG
ncbi:MAG: RNA pseudouridine synthase, partial [Acidobacteriota bacterium]